MRQGEILPPNRTNDEELALIEAHPVPLLGRGADLGKIGALKAAAAVLDRRTAEGSVPKVDQSNR